MQILRYKNYPVMPWKNELGETREILTNPEPGSPHAWRLSIADVIQSGPFSEFPDYLRTIIMLAGDGFLLEFENGINHALTTPYVPFDFYGGDSVFSNIVGAPSKDLNLMVHRDLARANTVVLNIEEEMTLPVLDDEVRLVFCLSGELQFATGQTMGTWDCASINEPSSQTIKPTLLNSKIFMADISSL